MNQSIQQRRAILDGLRQRAHSARAEFDAKPRFAVIPRGHNLFSVVDRHTGAERVEIAGHLNACQSAQKLEDAAQFTQAAQLTAGNVARWMTRWAMGFCLVLAAFAFYGAQQ